MFIGLYIHILYIHILFIYSVFSLFFFPNVLWYQFFVSGFQQLFVFGIKKAFFRHIEHDNSVSFHHAMFTHQCRNSEKYGINFFPYSSYWVRQQDALKCILKVRMYFNLRHVSASAMLTKVELPKR